MTEPPAPPAYRTIWIIVGKTLVHLVTTSVATGLTFLTFTRTASSLERELAGILAGVLYFLAFHDIVTTISEKYYSPATIPDIGVARVAGQLRKRSLVL